MELWVACVLLIAFTYFPFSLYGRYAYFHSLLGLDNSQGEKITLRGEGRESPFFLKPYRVGYRVDF